MVEAQTHTASAEQTSMIEGRGKERRNQHLYRIQGLFPVLLPNTILQHRSSQRADRRGRGPARVIPPWRAAGCVSLDVVRMGRRKRVFATIGSTGAMICRPKKPTTPGSGNAAQRNVKRSSRFENSGRAEAAAWTSEVEVMTMGMGEGLTMVGRR